MTYLMGTAWLLLPVFWNKQVSEKLCQGRFMSSISIKRWSRLEQQIDSSILSYITGKLLDVDTIAPISSSMIPVIWASRYIPQYDKWHIAGWAQIQCKAPWHSVPVYWMSVITVMAHGSLLFFFSLTGHRVNGAYTFTYQHRIMGKNCTLGCFEHIWFSLSAQGVRSHAM